MRAEGEFIDIKEEEYKKYLTKDYTLRLFKNFTVNTRNTVNLLAFPVILIADGFRNAKYSSLMIAEMVKNGLADKIKAPNFKNDLDEFSSKFRDVTIGLAYEKDVVKEAGDYFTHLTSKNELIHNAVRSLLHNVLVNTWTNYESNCKDLWIEVVNSNPYSVSSNEQLFNDKEK
jgi:hypothetical protein